MTCLHKDLTEKIIGAAMDVHKTLRSGFLESVYDEALAVEFKLQKNNFERQREIPVFYKGEQVK